MNKYQKAFENISICDECKCEQCRFFEDFWVLEELVNKSVPKKVKNIKDQYIPETYDYDYTDGNCPNCGEHIFFEYDCPQYCSNCGQRLEIPEDEE